MWDWISKLTELKDQGLSFVIATIVNFKGSTPRESGTKMIIMPDKRIFGTIGGGQLEKRVIDDAVSCFENRKSRLIHYPLTIENDQLCGGEVDVYFEVERIGPHLYLFGAGHVGQALCQALDGTPFTVHLVDDREEWVFSESLPKRVIPKHMKWNEFINNAKWDPDKTYIAIMTPGHHLDQDVLQNTIGKPHKYLGLMGSPQKWKEIQSNLVNEGISKTELEKVKCPIGLPIGGKSPKEIAVSIASELIKTHYARKF